MADALALPPEKLRCLVNARVAETVNLGRCRIEKDTIATVRGGWDGLVDGRVADVGLLTAPAGTWPRDCEENQSR